MSAIARSVVLFNQDAVPFVFQMAAGFLFYVVTSNVFRSLSLLRPKGAVAPKRLSSLCVTDNGLDKVGTEFYSLQSVR